jgi:glycosyltransferase involved in cell wall biosynthesis
VTSTSTSGDPLAAGGDGVSAPTPRRDRILLINYRYFVSGGPERYMFNVKELLEARGHEVIPFSIAYDRNEPSPYAEYFAPPLSSSSEVYFREQSGNLRSYVTTMERAFYSPTVYRRLMSLIEATRPDRAIVLHYLRKLSPSVLKCLADARVPFAVRLSDFAMVCPNAHLLRESQPCTLCVGGRLRHSVRHRCVQGSRAASAVNFAATKFHERAGYFGLIRRFLIPSRFSIQMMLDGGWEAEKLVHLPTPVSVPTVPPGEKATKPTVAFAGRLEPIKGVQTLLEAVALLEQDSDLPPFSVRIAGAGPEDHVRSLHSFASGHALKSVTFEGEQNRDDISRLLADAWCSVVPSRWYENVPNAALESMACRTPVIASAHGSLPEIVEHERTGLLVRPGDATHLAEALRRVITDRSLASQLGTDAHAYVSTHHSPESHYRRLIGALSDLAPSDPVTRRL